MMNVITCQYGQGLQPLLALLAFRGWSAAILDQIPYIKIEFGI